MGRPEWWPPIADPEDEVDYSGLTFKLTYRYDPTRKLWAGGVTGKEIPNAYKPTSKTWSPGEWHHEADDADLDPVRHALQCAVGEAVHEALEWLHLNGKPLIDPHNPALEPEVLSLATSLADGLFELAERHHGS